MSNLRQMEYTIDLSVSDNEFSGVIGVFSDGERVYKHASGYADRSNERENTVSTRFSIASGTKFFTALAIGQLIEANKLSLDTYALPLIPFAFPTYASDITIKHLLTHTSGIPDYFDEDEIPDFNNFQTETAWYNLKQPSDYFNIFPQRPMKFSPGASFSYCNSGYVLLASIIEQVSGKPYTTYVEEHILHRACMRHSGFYPMNQLPENTASGYIEQETGCRTNIYNLPLVGAGDGGLFTTLEDIERFWVSVLSGEIISTELLNDFFKPHVQTSKDKPNSFYGYGIWVDQLEDSSYRYAMTGCDPGVSFYSSHCSSKDSLITILSNTGDGAWPIVNSLKVMGL